MVVRSWSAMLSEAGVSTCESEARKEGVIILDVCRQQGKSERERRRIQGIDKVRRAR